MHDNFTSMVTEVQHLTIHGLLQPEPHTPGAALALLSGGATAATRLQAAKQSQGSGNLAFTPGGCLWLLH
jgi:hypothetical protein